MKKAPAKKSPTKKRKPTVHLPTVTPEGIPIHCLYEKLIPADQLTANPKNYRRHPDSHVAKLCGVIRANGWRKPIVVSRLSGLIVTGHGATMAGLSMKDSVPVEYQDFATPADEQRALIADNKASDGAKDDESALAALIKELEGVMPESLAMTAEELEAMTAIANGLGRPGAKSTSRKTPVAIISYNLIFDNLGQQERFYKFVNQFKQTRPDLVTFASRLDHAISTAPNQ